MFSKVCQNSGDSKVQTISTFRAAFKTDCYQFLIKSYFPLPQPNCEEEDNDNDCLDHLEDFMGAGRGVESEKTKDNIFHLLKLKVPHDSRFEIQTETAVW